MNRKPLVESEGKVQEKYVFIVLAAGKGTRMGGKLPKVLAETPSGTLLSLVLESLSSLTPEKIIVVTGYGRELVEDEIARWQKRSACKVAVETALQKEQNGTGDAVKSALPNLGDFSGEVFILCGDTPLITPNTLQKLLSDHQKNSSTLTVLTAQLPSPGSYGRMIRSETTGELLQICEAKDCLPNQLLVNEVNSGVYIVDSAFLTIAIDSLSDNNAQNEYYLTDIVEKAASEGQKISGSLCSSSDEILGVNTVSDLMRVNAVLKERALEVHQKNGVVIHSPSSTSIHPSATIGTGTSIGPSTYIGKGVTIGSGVEIEGLCRVVDSSIGDHSHLRWGLRIEGSQIGKNCLLGPFAHLRPGSILGDEVKIGNFVETKKSTLGDGAKASHLTYLGDAKIGKDANIGAGTITCNYDGYNKFETVIEDGAFIGSNTSLVAPVTVEKDATIGAGSTITKDVKSGALSLTRAEQRTIKGWSKKKKESNS